MSDNKQKEQSKKRIKINFLDILTLVVIVLILVIYAPKAVSLYSESKETANESNNANVVEYPLEVKISEEDTEFFINFFKEYALGITAGVDFLDGISENEMIDFCRVLLSEKYSSSGVISKTSMDALLKEYFDVSNIKYEDLGYKSLAVYKDYEALKVFNITKLMQLEKDGDTYIAYVDCIDKNKVTDGTYKKEDIEDIYIFTLKKITTEDTNNNDNSSSNTRYVIKKVEKENNYDNIKDNENSETKN